MTEHGPDGEQAPGAVRGDDGSAYGTPELPAVDVGDEFPGDSSSRAGSVTPEHAEADLPTLTAVFAKEQPKVQTERLLRQAAEQAHLELNEDDCRRAGELLRDQDRDLARTRRLVFEAAFESNGRYFEPIAEFVLGALPTDILSCGERDRLRSRHRLDARAAREFAEGTTQRLMHAADDAPTTDRNELLRRRRLFNGLMLTVVLLHRRSELHVDDVVTILSRSLGRAERGTRQTTVRQGVELAQLADPRLTKEGVRERLELVRRWVTQLRSASARLEEADQERVRHERRIRGLENQRQELQFRIATLEDELSGAREALIDSQKREAGAHAGGRLDLLEVTGRLENWLAGRLSSQLAVAREALGVTPARVQVADEKLEVVFEELEERLTWLRSLV